MKPATFAYHRAADVADALVRLRKDPEAKPLSGGQSLLALMNLRLSRPSTVVDLNALAELDRLFDDDGSLVVGARCTHRRLETDPVVRAQLPLLAEAAAHIGHIAIRNQGTIGGSVAHADPAAELPAVLLALNATMYVDAHPGTRRTVAARDFFVSFYTTSLEPSELLTWIRIPKPDPRSGWGFHEIARRRGDFASAGAVAVLDTAGGEVSRARCVLFGVADRPLLFEALDELVGVQLDDDQVWPRACAAAAAAVTAGLQPPEQGDLKRRHARRALGVALDQARIRADTGDAA